MTDQLTAEAATAIARGLQELRTHNTSNTHTHTAKEAQTMSTDTTTMNHPTLTPEQARDLYLAGRTVWEIAQGYGLTYAKARKILAASNTPIRSASARLKGRTRKAKTTADA